jgi:hypothetical protein
MSTELPSALLQDPDTETLVDACYFIIRALRNTTRGYKNPLVSTEPSQEAYDLAQRAIREIEVNEKRPIRALDGDRINDYIAQLEEFLRTSYRDAVGEDPARAANILAEMRSSEFSDERPT